VVVRDRIVVGQIGQPRDLRVERVDDERHGR
jgi:hypothetical protein